MNMLGDMAKENQVSDKTEVANQLTSNKEMMGVDPVQSQESLKVEEKGGRVRCRSDAV